MLEGLEILSWLRTEVGALCVGGSLQDEKARVLQLYAVPGRLAAVVLECEVADAEKRVFPRLFGFFIFGRGRLQEPGRGILEVREDRDSAEFVGARFRISAVERARVDRDLFHVRTFII